MTETASAQRTAKGGVLLVSMPWERLSSPSIQLGTLLSLLRRHGIATDARSFKLQLVERLAEEGSGGSPLGPAHYKRIAEQHYRLGIGEWIFRVPPLDVLDEAEEAEYFAYLRREGVAGEDLVTARRMREAVPAFLAECVADILDAGPAVVGFTTTFAQTVPSLVLAKMLKERRPSLQIIFGGANCDGPMGAALHRTYPWIDVVVRGEAEHLLPGLAAELCAGRPVTPRSGLCYRAADGQQVIVEQSGDGLANMDEVPLPDYDEYFDRLSRCSFYGEILPELNLLYESARGCWWGEKHHCTFCGLNGGAMKFRSKSPVRAGEEILALVRKYKCLDVSVVDNIIDMEYIEIFLPILRDAGWDIDLFYETKANLKRHQVQALRAAGVASIQPGIESLSTPILRLMKKGVTALQNIRLLKWAAEHGLYLHWNIIYGFPGEPIEEYPRMADLARSLTHLCAPSISPLSIERFSPYFNAPDEHGIELTGPRTPYRYLHRTDPATLFDIAYHFDVVYRDGRDPETYSAPLQDIVRKWQEREVESRYSLSHERGPGFLIVRDERPDLPPRVHKLYGWRAAAYAAIDGGTAARDVMAALAGGEQPPGASELDAFLTQLVGDRLAYEEDGRFLALSLPAIAHRRWWI